MEDEVGYGKAVYLLWVPVHYGWCACLVANCTYSTCSLLLRTTVPNSIPVTPLRLSPPTHSSIAVVILSLLTYSCDKPIVIVSYRGINLCSLIIYVNQIRYGM